MLQLRTKYCDLLKMVEYTVITPEYQWYNSKKYGMKMKFIILIGIGIGISIITLLTVLSWQLTVFSDGNDREGDM